MSSRVYLELDKVKINGFGKNKWNLYMIFMMDHPEFPDQKIITTIPEDGLLMQIQNKDRDRYSFKSKPITPVTSGKRILDIEMPDDCYVELSCLVMHSRDKHRKVGEILKTIADTISLPDMPGELQILNLSVPWLVVANKALDGAEILGEQLIGIKDRKLDLIHIQGNFSTIKADNQVIPVQAGTANNGKGALLFFDWRVA